MRDQVRRQFPGGKLLVQLLVLSVIGIGQSVGVGVVPGLASPPAVARAEAASPAPKRQGPELVAGILENTYIHALVASPAPGGQSWRILVERRAAGSWRISQSHRVGQGEQVLQRPTAGVYRFRVPRQHGFGRIVTGRLRATGERPNAYSLRPDPRVARSDRARTYASGCHAGVAVTVPVTCALGDVDSPVRIVVVGDSHVAHWLGALDVAGRRNGWRIISLTKSHCPVADATVAHFASTAQFRECDAWRRNALEWLRVNGPFDAVFAADYDQHLVFSRSTGRLLARSAAHREWRAATLRVAPQLLRASPRVLWVRALPELGRDIPACLRANPHSIGRCDTPAASAYDAIARRWRSERSALRDFRRVATHDFSGNICPAGMCTVNAGKVLKFRDANHISNTYSRRLAPAVAAAVREAADL